MTISKSTFEQALQHAQTAAQHGQEFEKLARSLEGSLLTRAEAEFIEGVGQQIQKHSQEMKALIEQALSDEESDLLEIYTLVHQHHSEAVALHCDANNVLVQANKSALSAHHPEGAEQ